MKKSSRKSSRKMSKKAKKYLQKKIKKNISEFKSGKKMRNGRKIKSIKQAIAIAYSQTNKKFKLG